MKFKAAWPARLKALGRWVVVGTTLAFLGFTLVHNWVAVSAIRIDAGGWSLVLAALGVTLAAHAWSGWVWSWALQALQQPIRGGWTTLVYLQTNLLKYLPGNVWHFFGRVYALEGRGVDRGVAIVGVALEPLLMAAAALVVALLIGMATPTQYWLWQVGLLGVILELLAPRRLNPMVKRLGQSKAAKASEAGDFKIQNSKFKISATPTPAAPTTAPSAPSAHGLRHYPLKPLAGQLGYVVLRGVGFVLVLSAVTPLTLADWPTTISAFSLAWLAGLVVPGAPGGVGVFEAIALGLLQGTFSPAAVLSAVLLYRLVNTLAEALGAALATLSQRLFDTLR